MFIHTKNISVSIDIATHKYTEFIDMQLKKIQKLKTAHISSQKQWVSPNEVISHNLINWNYQCIHLNDMLLFNNNDYFR